MAEPEMSDLESKTRYDPSEVEPRIVRRWLDSGLFHPAAGGDGGGELLDRDPATERDRVASHGHAYNDAMMDTLIRRHRMAGQRTKWILGTDHAGIATQTQVERRWSPRERAVSSSAASSSRRGCGVGASSTAARSSSSSSASAPRAITTTSVSRSTSTTPTRCCACSWPYTRRATSTATGTWSTGTPGSRSAISDLEVEDREVTDTLYYIDYPLASGSGAITVATVRPETMLADVAVAVNPEDDRYDELVGRDGDPAACRPGASDHRRRVRQARVRDRRAEDHARARPQRLRDRPPARTRADQRDRRGRPDHRRGARAVPSAERERRGTPS